MGGIDYKVLSDKRLKVLENIRLLIKKYQSNDYIGCIGANLTDSLSNIFQQAEMTEKARNAFRDELLRRGCTHHDLVGLVENYKNENI